MRRLRGRPRHDDVLTPREWEVLSLLREGLTNEQIAIRLNITFDTAKFHVSEILGKLGVESRQEAAAWRGEPRSVPVPAAAPSIWQRAGLTSPVRVFAATVLATVAVGMLALAGGLLLMNSREGEKQPASEAQGRTGDEALDALIDSALTGDAASLTTRFAGVAAREGVVIGGPVGLAEPVQVLPADQWTARLVSASRDLYAVVRDPTEPYPWNQSLPPPVPRAALFSAQRDYDVLLIVDEPDRPATPWRISVLDGQIVDFIIDNSGVQGQSSPAVGGRPLLSRVADLIPPPDSQPGSFVVLPPEEEWPPPIHPAASGPPKPAGVTAPSRAPDGRTGQHELDEAIDSLLTDDERELATRYGGLAGQESRCEPDPSLATSCTSFGARVPVANWTKRLSQGKRSLYAVATGNGESIDIVIGVEAGGPQREAWRFGTKGGTVERLSITNPLPPASIDPAVAASPDFKTQLLKMSVPPPAQDYDRFFVLPPPDQLPQRPAMHALSVRTGDPGVDALLDAIASRDSERIVDALASADATNVRSCYGHPSFYGADHVRDWANTTLSSITGINAVANVPLGHVPAADHMIVLMREVNPLRSRAVGVYEQGGRIVGLFVDGDLCEPAAIYPPSGYVVAPPAGWPFTGLDRSRRSGIATVDAVLNAAHSGNTAALANLISYQKVACLNQEYGPPCPPGVPNGTLVDVINHSVCHGGYEDPHSAPRVLVDMISRGALYAVPNAVPPMHPPHPLDPEGTVVVMVASASESFALTIDGKGVASIERRCAPSDPDLLIRGTPSFLLPPP